ncbi:hypothetical protein [Desulfogranum marinum]|uniref:hypothetical protein n=1 Tax=Desulfogranum marinum TaxID=453220 RepID=UPI001964ABDD|nr:hypothetical protein [Desulfogranum marinum]MBM9514070.1 hypothetical protein [Desulfogranum marinum]
MNENEAKREPRKSNLTPSYLEVVLIVLIVVGGAVYGYDRYFAQKVKVVDMSSYLRRQKEQIATGEITADAFKVDLERVDQLVSQDAELHHNHIYILKEVVLKNGEELRLDQ